MKETDKENQLNKKYLEDAFDLYDIQEKLEVEKRRKFRKKNEKAINILNIIIGALVIVIVFLSAQVYMYYRDISKNKDAARIAQEITSSLGAGEESRPNTPPEPTDQADTPEEQQSLPDERPEILALQREFNNTDIIGYVEIEGTNIHYPVVQSDDNDFYLYRDFYGNENVAGSVFMDYDNLVYPLQNNTILYGHNMKDGSMFHNLRFYSDKNYYNEHKYIHFITLYEETTWEIFSFYSTTTDFNYIQTEFNDPAQFEQLLLEMVYRSFYDTGVSVSAADKVLTLSTCTNGEDDERFVVNAKKIL